MQQRRGLFHNTLASSLPFSHDLVSIVAGYIHSPAEPKDAKTEQSKSEIKREEEDQKQLEIAKTLLLDSKKIKLARAAATNGWIKTLTLLANSIDVNATIKCGHEWGGLLFPKFQYESTLLLEACMSIESNTATRLFLINKSSPAVINQCYVVNSHGSAYYRSNGASPARFALEQGDCQATSLLLKKGGGFAEIRTLPNDPQTLSLFFSQAPACAEHFVKQQNEYFQKCFKQFVEEQALTASLLEQIQPQLSQFLEIESGKHRKRFTAVLEAAVRCFTRDQLNLLVLSQIACFANNTAFNASLLDTMLILDMHWLDPAKMQNRDNAELYINKLNAIHIAIVDNLPEASKETCANLGLRLLF